MTDIPFSDKIPDIKFSFLLNACDLIIASSPTEGSLNILSEMLKDFTLYEYFFNNLNNPEWIIPLYERGYFSHPPAPIEDAERKTVSFPFWAALRFLRKQAKSAPESVLSIILKIPFNDNITVLDQINQIALELPADLAVEIAKIEIEWLSRQKRQIFGHVGLDLANLVTHLANGGQFEAAVELAKSLLIIFSDPKAEEKSKDKSIYFEPEPNTLLSNWEYEQVLGKNVLELASLEPLRILTLVSDLLNSALKIRYGQNNENSFEDYSEIWRPRAESGQHSGIKDLLTSGVHRICQQIAEKDSSLIPKVVAILEAYKWTIFIRLALSLLQNFSDNAEDLIIERLTDKNLFEDGSYSHEYFGLAESQFNLLSEEQKQTFFQWIEEGPKTGRDQYNERLKEFWGKEIEGNEYDYYVMAWKRDRLARIQKYLEGDWKELYADLIEHAGKPADFASRRDIITRFGESSPISSKDLSSLSTDEVIDYLKTWEPSGELESPTRAGLASELTNLVTSAPLQYSELADRFLALDAAYISALITGLRQSVESREPVEWNSILQLCREITTASSEREDGEANKSIGDDQKTLTRNVTYFLSSAFKSREHFPIEFRQIAWDSLHPVTQHPEPTEQYEKEYGGSNMDPLTLSLNTIRGGAMHAVIEYALWVRSYMEKSENFADLLKEGFEHMPEVRKVLEEHLDPQKDPALSIRSIYGQWFPWLVLLDENWARQNVQSVFPDEPKFSILRDVAWQTYLNFCDAYDSVFDMLSNEYEKALNRLGEKYIGRQQSLTLDERLANHLLTFYWRDKIKLDDPLLNLFF